MPTTTEGPNSNTIVIPTLYSQDDRDFIPPLYSSTNSQTKMYYERVSAWAENIDRYGDIHLKNSYYVEPPKTKGNKESLIRDQLYEACVAPIETTTNDIMMPKIEPMIAPKKRRVSQKIIHISVQSILKEFGFDRSIIKANIREFDGKLYLRTASVSPDDTYKWLLLSPKEIDIITRYNSMMFINEIGGYIWLDSETEELSFIGCNNDLQSQIEKVIAESKIKNKLDKTKEMEDFITVQPIEEIQPIEEPSNQKKSSSNKKGTSRMVPTLDLLDANVSM